MDIQINKTLYITLNKGELEEKYLSNADTPPSAFAATLQHGPPTCSLISGYRGTGKSSLIASLKTIIGGQPDSKTVFVQVDFSRYQEKANLFRWLIRELYLALQEHSAYTSLKLREASKEEKDRASSLLEILHEKTFYDSTQTLVQSTDLTRTITVTVDLLRFIGYIFLGWFLIIGLNLLFSVASWPIVNGILSLGTILATIIKATITIKASWEQKKVNHEDLTRKTLFDNEIADHHFLTLLRKFRLAELNLVFVLDEMDKVDDALLNKLATDIKPYMLSGYAHFIVVSGQKLFYQYKQANTQDDAVLSSIFSKCIHLGLLSRVGFHDLFKALLIKPVGESKDLTPQENLFADNLIFRCKRVPRKFFQLLQEQIQWQPNELATVVISSDASDLSIYGRFLDMIDSIEMEDIAPEAFHPAEKDFLIMQLLLACTSLLDNKNVAFTIESFVIADTEMQNTESIPSAHHFGTRMRELQLRYLDRLFSRLEEANLVKKDGDKFSWPPAARQDENQPTIPKETGSDIHRLNDFRNLVNNVSIELGLTNSKDIQSAKFSQLLRILQREGAFRAPFLDQNNVSQTLDKLNDLTRDPKGTEIIKQTIEAAKIRISNLTNRLMEYYAKSKAELHFRQFGYAIDPNPHENQIDFSLQSYDSGKRFKTLVFEVIVRRGDPLSSRQYYWDKLRQLNVISPEGFYFMIVFCELNASTREVVKAKFQTWLDDDAEMSPLYDRVQFIPVHLYELQGLQDAFQSFTNEYITRSFERVFKDQQAPRQFHERNDDEIVELIEFKKYDFTIRITPDDTKFWRFGLRFLKNSNLPVKNQGRHANPEIADITLCAGEAKVDEKGYHTWNHPDQLVLSSHQISAIREDRWVMANYDGTTVTLTCIPEAGGRKTRFKTEGDSFTPLEQTFNLQDYKYCILSAWCDDQPFSLKTNIRLERRVE